MDLRILTISVFCNCQYSVLSHLQLLPEILLLREENKRAANCGSLLR